MSLQLKNHFQRSSTLISAWILLLGCGLVTSPVTYETTIGGPQNQPTGATNKESGHPGMAGLLKPGGFTGGPDPKTIGANSYDIFTGAQGSIGSLNISGIDYSEFPKIKFIMQALDSNSNPIATLTPQSISVSESGRHVDISMNPTEVGIRVVFIIDDGMGISANGATGKSRLLEMKSTITDFLSQMNASDSVAILAQEGDTTNEVSNFSSSASDLQTVLDQYPFTASQVSSGYMGILSGLSKLNVQADEKASFIVFLSSGIQNAKPDIYTNMVNQLTTKAHPIINTILFRATDDGYGSRLSEIAKLGGGTYFHFTSREQTANLYQTMGVWRKKYLITFRSPNSQSGNREIIVTASSNNITTSAIYSIRLQSPLISIEEPINGSTVTRPLVAATKGQNEVGTDFTNVKIKVEWPDGFPRKIANASVIVNNQTQGAITNPNVDSSSELNVPWELRSYGQVGQNPVSMQIQVTDELGITSSSKPVQIIVLVQSEVCHGIPDFLCSAVMAVSPYTPWFAAIIAIVALTLVIVFRRQIASVGSPILERGIEFVTRVTKRRTVSTPKAYLEALAGIESGRKTFELFGTTPIGRSRRHAELIFQATDEESPISRLHCTILEDENVFSIRDEDSQWGTYLNGKKLEALAPEKLHEGDLIELGQAERGGIKLRFSLYASEQSEESTNLQNGESLKNNDEEDGVTKPRRR